MKSQKNWLYAYRNLEESLQEIEPRLARIKLDIPNKLSKEIDLKTTPGQLEICIRILKKDEEEIKQSDSLDIQVTKMLLHRFITDASIFKANFEHDFVKAAGEESSFIHNSED